MNRKKFWADFNLLKQWLQSQNLYKDDLLIVKIIALIFLGHTQPEIILGKAVTSPRILDIFHLNEVPKIKLPTKLEKLLGYWIHSLPRETSFIGEIYEKLSLSRRVKGIYYTPQPIIDFIIEHTLKTCNIIENPYIKILDPACGCGYFLSKAYDVLFNNFSKDRLRLQKKYPDTDWSDAGIHHHILIHNLWGADIDSQAVEITWVSLLLKNKSSPYAIAPNIITYDSLKKTEDIIAPEEIVRFWSQEYDFVIGNPPYLSFGLRGTGKLDETYKDYLRQNYSASAEYKLSYYVLFMQRGIEMLKEEGRLGFILPDSFLLGRYYSKIRRFIMDNAYIHLIVHLSTSVFRNAATGYSAICILIKKNAQTQIKDNLMTIYQISSLEKLDRAIPVCQYEQQYFSTLPYNRFRIFFDPQIKSIIEYIDTISLPLNHFATGHTGIRSITRQEDVIANSKPNHCTWHKGLISGSQITRYGLQYKGHWLNIDPALIYKGGWRSEIIEQRKILLRQTGDSIIACIDEEHLYHLNNIHSFILKSNRITLDYLLILLNSELLSFYYHVTSMEYGRSMAQTDIETIELLPIIVNDMINLQAPELVNIMNQLVQRHLEGDFSVKNKINALENYFNQLVYKIYKLTDLQTTYIQDYENNLRKN